MSFYIVFVCWLCADFIGNETHWSRIARFKDLSCYNLLNCRIQSHIVLNIKTQMQISLA